MATLYHPSAWLFALQPHWLSSFPNKYVKKMEHGLIDGEQNCLNPETERA
jgi:hypothetical protein